MLLFCHALNIKGFIVKVYQTDGSGFLVGEVIAKNDPLGGGFLIPAGCVIEAPPKSENKKAAQYINGKWALVDDLKGVKYWLNGEALEVKERGESLPVGAVLEEPIDLVQAREALEKKQQIIGELSVIDLQTIRAMREYIASKPDAPQILKEREALAIEARANLNV